MKSLLFANFDMKDLGEAKVILGIKIIRFEKGIFFINLTTSRSF